MSLAILHWESADNHSYHFKIDIGTNEYYQFKIGKQIVTRAGIRWVDDISKVTPFQRKKKLTFLGDSEEEVALPKKYFDRENCLVQLCSAKDSNGRAPAVSKVIRIPVAMQQINTMHFNLSSSASTMMDTTDFNPVRNITAEQQSLSQQTSVEDILGGLVRAVLPAAISYLNPQTTTAAPGSGATGNNSSTNMLTNLLGAVLRAVAPSIPGFSGQQSISYAADSDNRFGNYSSDLPGNNQFSKPFVFGIDAALLASMAGPIIQQELQLLPHLINAANQHKLQTLQANNQLMSTLAGDVQRRMMMQQLMQNQPPAGGTPNINLAVLAQ